MPTIITQEPPNSPDAMQLIAELDDVLSPLYAAESRHGFSVEKLLRDGVTLRSTCGWGSGSLWRYFDCGQ